jgi:hypothetical protein
MFPYDPKLVALTNKPPQSIPDVLQCLTAIETTCVDRDGLKWFDWLYLQVTQAVQTRVAAGGFNDPAWLAELDVQFAKLYTSAINTELQGAPGPGCWKALLAVRDDKRIARIQFALAGVNAHINHDLPEAIVATCEKTNTTPTHGGPQYADYSALQTTLDDMVEEAKKTLHVRLLGDQLPAVSHLDALLAGWSISAAREKAWQSAEALWGLRGVPLLANGLLDSLDGLTTALGKALLVPVP